MGIQKDAEEILIYTYKHYTENSRVPSREEICQNTKWDVSRIKRAIDYLLDKNFIKATKIAGGLPILHGVSADGVDVIENPKKFQKHFDHTIDLKFYKYSWGVTEK